MATVGTPTPITSTRTTTGTITTRGRTYTKAPEIKGGGAPSGGELPITTEEEEIKEAPQVITTPERGKAYAPGAMERGTKATVSRPINDLRGSVTALSPARSQEQQFRRTTIGQAIEGADIRNWPRIIKQGPQSEAERYGATLTAFTFVGGGAASLSGLQIPATIQAAKTPAGRIAQGVAKDVGLFAGSTAAGKYVIQPALETSARIQTPELRGLTAEQIKSAEIVRVKAEQQEVGKGFAKFAYDISQGLTDKEVKEAGIKASSKYLISETGMSAAQAEKAAAAQRKASVYGEATNLVFIGASSNRMGGKLLSELGEAKTLRQAALKSFAAVGRAGAYEGAATAEATQRYRPTLETPGQKSLEIAAGAGVGALSAGTLGSIQGTQAFKRTQPVFSKTATIAKQKLTTTVAYITDPFEAQGDIADDIARSIGNKLKNVGKGGGRVRTYAFTMPKAYPKADIGTGTMADVLPNIAPEATPQVTPQVSPITSPFTNVAPQVNPKESINTNTFVNTMVNVKPNTFTNVNPVVGKYGLITPKAKKLSFNMPAFGGRSQFKGKGAKTFYVPSLTALGLGITGKVTQKKFSGLELRPIKLTKR